MGMILRRFHKNDEAQIVELFNACFEGHRTLEEWKWMYLQMPGFDPSGILVAEDQEAQKLVASLAIFETNICLNDRKHVVGIIDDVDTLEAWRRRGIATRLMRMAIEECKRRRYSAVFLYAYPYREAIGIYRGMGFKDAQDFTIHGKIGSLRMAARNTPFPMNLAAPAMALLSAVNSKRQATRSLANTHEVDPHNDQECEAYLEALNDSLRTMPLFYPYSRSHLNWLIRDAPKSVSPVARYIEKNGRIVCGANASIYRMKLFERTFNTWVVGDLFTSGTLQSSETEDCIRSLMKDLVQDGEDRGCPMYMVISSKFDARISKSLRTCGFIGFVSASFMCLPLELGFALPPKDAPWYCWKQHMIGVP